MLTSKKQKRTTTTTISFVVWCCGWVLEVALPVEFEIGVRCMCGPKYQRHRAQGIRTVQEVTAYTDHKDNWNGPCGIMMCGVIYLSEDCVSATSVGFKNAIYFNPIVS